MSPTELKAPILATVHTLLRTKGYRKTASVFLRSSEDVVHVIEVQGSRDNTSAVARFTINVGVFAMELVYPDVRDVTKPSIPAAHWRERLGFLCPESQDLWWAVSSLRDAETAAQDMAARLEQYALPMLSSLSNLSALVALWKSGRSPGITEHQRKDYLSQLNSSEEHR